MGILCGKLPAAGVAMAMALALAAFAALAQPVPVPMSAPVTVANIAYLSPAEVQGSRLVLNGAGVRYKTVFKVYTAGLYLEKPAWPAATRLETQGRPAGQTGLSNAGNGYAACHPK